MFLTSTLVGGELCLDVSEKLKAFNLISGGHVAAQLVEALCNKPESRGI
jgi:hypothetical protein